MTYAIKASERAKRASIDKNVEKHEFNQIRRAKKSCEFCIVIKQKFESHKNFVILDKHFLNLIWNDLVEFFVFNDKIKYFVTFLCDFIKRSMIYVLRVKLNTFEVFKHFQLHNEHENNRVRRFRTNWEKNTQTMNSMIIVSNMTLNENQLYQKFSSKMKSSNVQNKSSCQWSTSCSKTSIETTNDESNWSRQSIIFEIVFRWSTNQSFLTKSTRKKSFHSLIFVASRHSTMLWNENRSRDKKS